LESYEKPLIPRPISALPIPVHHIDIPSARY
jgi:hypothetical protein